MAKAPRHVADPFVDSENFLADENDRRTLPTRWPCVIDRHVAARDFHRRLTGVEALGIGANDVGADRARGERIAGGGRGGTRHEATPRQRRHDFGKSDDIGRQLMLIHWWVSPGIKDLCVTTAGRAANLICRRNPA